MRLRGQGGMQRGLRKGLLTAGVSLGALAAPFAVHAQTTTAPEGEVSQVDEVVVTGSRLQRSGLDAPTPTMAMTAETIEAKGITNVAEILNEMPQVATGLSNANTSYSFGNIGLNQVNLRNLGVRRTLTMVNGRRRAGTPDDSNFLAFDLSNIPAALVKRVEVQTGGTSASSAIGTRNSWSRGHR